MKSESSLVTKEDVLLLMDHVMSRISNEDRLSSERTNLFLVSNSFLVAGFIFAFSFDNGRRIALVLTVFGIFLSLLHFCLMHYNINAIRIFSRIRNNLEKHSSIGNVNPKLTPCDNAILTPS